MSTVKYSTAQSVNISGKCFDFIADTDIQNGFVCAKGEQDGDFLSAEIPALTDEIFLVCSPAVNDGEYSPQNELGFINKAGKPFRAYGLLAANHDRFGVSAAGISSENDIQAGDYITVDGSSYKLTNAGSTAPASSSYGFIGRVAEIDAGELFSLMPDGTMGAKDDLVIIEVIKNENV